MGWSLHPLIYNEIFSSLVDVGSPTHSPHAETDSLCVEQHIMGNPIMVR